MIEVKELHKSFDGFEALRGNYPLRREVWDQA